MVDRRVDVGRLLLMLEDFFCARCQYAAAAARGGYKVPVARFEDGGVVDTPGRHAMPGWHPTA